MRKRWYHRTTEEIYAYRTRKPSAPFGLPLAGRHWAYVGRTARPGQRHREHLIGGGRYSAVAKPWADLEPRRYVLARWKPRTRLATHLLELFWIRLLMPVYNVSMNKGNPRRIKPWTATRQRALRDRFGTPARVGHLVLRAGVIAGVLSLTWAYAPR